MSGVADGTNDRDAGGRTFLDRLRQRIVQIAGLFVAAGRDVDDANAVFFAVFEHPFESVLDVPIRDAAGACQLDQNDIGVRSDAAIETI